MFNYTHFKTKHSKGDLCKSGIYIISCNVNKKFYIGSTTNMFKRRLGHHYGALVRNKHRNSYLQNSFNKYSEKAFSFSILEYVNDNSRMLDREQYWIDKLDALNKGFNMLPKTHTTKGRVVRKETRLKLIKSLTGRTRGLAVRKALGKPCQQYDVCGNFIAEYYSTTEAGRQTGIQRQDIGKVCRGLLYTAGSYQWKYKEDNKQIGKISRTSGKSRGCIE